MNNAPHLRPNLLLIGAQKSGTTSLASALAAHREIFLPPEKEMNFFSRKEHARDQELYYSRFKNHPGIKYWMDATPGYMWTRTAYGRALGDHSPMQHDVPEVIRAALGMDIRLLAIMRHPVRRAVSAFFHHFRMGRLRTSDRIRNMGYRQGIVDLGFYSEHLARYREVFPAENMKMLFLEDYMRNAERTQTELFEWLDLDPSNCRATNSDANQGIKLDYGPDRISVRSGMAQIRELSRHPNYKKMKLIQPPIVEQADLDFLNEVYAAELACMAEEYPLTRELWPRNLTLEDYFATPADEGPHSDPAAAGGRESHPTSELARMADLLRQQEARHAEQIENLEARLADCRRDIDRLQRHIDKVAPE